MSRQDPGTIVDGFGALPLGVHSVLAPDELPPGQVSWAVNTAFRNQYPTCRPGIREVPVTFSNMDGELFSLERIQGAGIYENREKAFMLIAAAGRLFNLDLQTMAMVRLDAGDDSDRNAGSVQLVEFCQGEQFMVVRDGQAKPWVWDGGALRRLHSDAGGAQRELPGGLVMEYGMGRFWCAFPGGQTFMAGDLVYGPSGTGAYARADAILKNTENKYLNSKGEFTTGMTSGPLRAMRFIGNLDTSLGQGPLIVFTERGAFGVNCPVDKTTWENMTYPIQSVSLVGSGAVSSRGTIAANGDIWYRSRDGIRSFQVARREYNTWVRAPMSLEVGRILEYDQENLLLYCSAVYFDNRLIFTCSPFCKQFYEEIPARVLWRGMVVLNTQPVASMTNPTTPIWDGLWTGPAIIQILKATVGGVERCFILGNDGESNRLYEMSPDWDCDKDDQPIEWWFEGPAFRFQDNRHAAMDLKQLATGDVWVDDLKGTVDFSLSYRTNGQRCWNDWHAWQECATDRDCVMACPPAAPLQLQSRYRMRLPAPPEKCNQIDGRPATVGYTFQPRLSIKGKCTVKALRLIAREKQEDVAGECLSASATCKRAQCCQPDNFSYAF